MKTPTIDSVRQARALALHARLPQIDITRVPVMSNDRHITRKEQARLARNLFKLLDIKGISVTAPNYSMAQSIDVRLPQRQDYVFNAAGMVDDYEKDPAASANRDAKQSIEAILLAAFPNHDNRSDSMTDYFDYCWSID